MEKIQRGKIVCKSKNVAKQLCSSFDYWLERLFNDIHTNFKYCREYKLLISKICGIGNLKFSPSALHIPLLAECI